MSSSPVPGQSQRLCSTSWTGPAPLAWMRSRLISSLWVVSPPGGLGWLGRLGLARVGSVESPGRRDSEVAGEILVGVLGQDEPGGGEDGHWVLAGRGEDVDG